MSIILPVLLILCAYYFSKFIRLNAVILYILAIFISSASIMLYSDGYFYIINSGTVGISFLLIVMLTGILKPGSKIKKQLNSIRREYAILGFLFLSPHVYLGIYESIINQVPITIIPIITYILMIPLFVTSFKLVKRSMITSSWIQLHKTAYIVYFLVFIHAVSVSTTSHLITYYIIFGTYLFLKIYHKSERHALLKASLFTVLIGSSSLIFITDIDDYIQEPYDIIEGNDFQDGTYVGYAKGYSNLDTVVLVEIEDNKIKYVIIEECGCTPNISDNVYADAAYYIAGEIKSENATDIDAVAGVTKTSKAIDNAVIDALEHAIID